MTNLKLYCQIYVVQKCLDGDMDAMAHFNRARHEKLKRRPLAHPFPQERALSSYHISYPFALISARHPVEFPHPIRAQILSRVPFSKIIMQHTYVYNVW
jgi:hypothetical protein